MREPTETPEAFSRWFFDTLDASQAAEGALRNALLELRHLLQADTLDDETRADLIRVQTWLEQATGRLAMLHRSAGAVFDALVSPEPLPQILERNRSRGGGEGPQDS